tara:strand:- start:2042 stop:2902 length:861 start_codon:yes stop_codon:yes gene_type:complete
MKKIIYMLFLSNLIFAQTAILDTNTILIGQQTKYTINNDKENTDFWPYYDKLLTENIEIIEASIIDTNNGIMSQYFTITSWDSGTYYIPPIIFSDNYQTKGAMLNVKIPILDNDAKLKGIKKPIEEPIGWRDILPWLIFALIIFPSAYYIKKYLSTKKDNIPDNKIKNITPSDILALKQLTKLEEDKVWQRGEIKEYYSRLSEIIRRYTEERFKFIALEMTTDEILEKLKSTSKIDKKNLKNLQITLQRADLAKFAKSIPIRDENIESMDLAKNFIVNTKEIKKDE